MSLQEQYPNILLESEFVSKSSQSQMDVSLPMIINHHRRASKCIVSDDEEEDDVQQQQQQQITLNDSLHKMRRVTQESAKSIIIQNNESRIIKKRKVIIEESEDDESEEKVKQCDVLTMFSTSCSNLSQSSASRANSTFSAATQEEQEQFSVSGQYKFTDLYTTLPLELTLEQIISDAKSGTPSLLEEKARQNKVLKQRQLKNSKIISSESTESSSVCVSQLNITSQQSATTIIEQQPIVVFVPSENTNTNIDPKLVKERLVTRINSNTFSQRKTHTKKWSDEETLRFFKGLQAFGTDFSLIQQLFPERTRAQIKNKFRKEEKENNKIVEESIKLNQKRRYNKIQAKLTIEKEKIEAITPETQVEERIDLLRQVRSKRLNSFESVDSADIEVAEKINEIFKRENTAASQNASIMMI